MFAIDYDAAPFDPDGPTQADLSTLPKGLATMAPGRELAALLAGIDVTGLSGYDQMIVLEAEHRQASHYQGRAYRTMAAIADTYQAEAGVPRPLRPSTARPVTARTRPQPARLTHRSSTPA